MTLEVGGGYTKVIRRLVSRVGW